MVSTHETTLKRALGLPSLTLFGLAYMVPLTVFTTYGIVTTVSRGHLPAAYVVTLATMLFTAYSYANMVRAYPRAGSAYTYTQRSFGSHLGFMTGWSLMLDYLCLPMINYLVIGIYMSAQFPSVPAWVWVISAICLVTILNILGISLVAKANFFLITLQIVFIVVFVILSIRKVVSSTTEPNFIFPFFSPHMSISSVVGGSAILCLSFLGFDAISTLSEEAKDASRSVPRAIIICTLAGGGIFILISYVGHLVFPNWHSFGDPDSAALDIMKTAGGVFLSTFFTSAYVAGCIASAMASQVSVSRILFAMGRDGVLPSRIFGRLHQRFQTPHLSTLVVGAISLTALIISLDTLSSIISFGALIAFTLVNLSVIKHYVVDRHYRGRTSIQKYVVPPVIGVLLCLWLWTSLSAITFIVGVSWVALGFIYLVGLTRAFRRRPPEIEFGE